MRVGITYNVGSGSGGSVPVSYSVIVEDEYRYADYHEHFTVSGADSASGTFDNVYNPGSVFTVYSGSFNTSQYYGSTASVSLSASVSGTYNGSAPSVTASIPIPARSYDSPSSPGSIDVTRNSDTSIVVSWTRNAFPNAPYTSQEIARSINGAAFVTVARISGNYSNTGTQSWTDTSAPTDANVAYEMRALNTSGASGWHQAQNAVVTTPATPGQLSASLTGSSQITLKWVNSTKLPTDAYAVEISRSVAGGAWTVVASGISGGTSSWVDNSPGGGSNQYRIRYASTFYNNSNTPTTIYSTNYSTSNVVSTIVPPLAPTKLAPNGAPADASNPITLTWQHNSGGDGAAASAYQIRWMLQGGTSWNTMSVTKSTASTFTVPAGTWSNGQTVVWQVADYGLSPTESPWSNSATITLSTTPTVAPITQPTDPVQVMPVSVAWTYAQAEGLTQTSYTVQVLNPAGTDAVYSYTGNGATTTHLPAYTFVNGNTYTIRVRAFDGLLWSNWVTKTFTINLLPPANVDTAASFDCNTGAVTLNITSDVPVQGKSTDVSTVDVQRSLDGGQTWVTLFPGVDMTVDQATLVDTTAPVTGTVMYQCIVTSISPSQAIDGQATLDMDAITKAADCQWGYLSWSDGFTIIARGQCTPSTGESTGRSSAALPVVGRRYPILLMGQQRTRKVDVKFQLAWGFACTNDDDATSMPDDFLQAGKDATTVLWRDWSGRRIFGMLSDVDVTWSSSYTADVAFSITRTDWHEGADQASPLDPNALTVE